MKTLVVLEAPGKVAKVQKFLGNSYMVLPTCGHIMEFTKDNKTAIDINNGFTPNLVVADDKKEIVSNLKDAYKKCDDIVILTDLDREGTGIGYTVCKVLNINPKTVKRGITNEINEKAVKRAVENPGKLDLNMVDAFLSRKILDRLVGFSFSPLLWKIQPKLSGGRVQSAVLLILTNLEKEHKKFNATADFKVTAIFEVKDSKNKIQTFKSTFNKRFKNKEDAEKFLKSCIGKKFFIKSIQTKETKRNPSAPFISSSIQQEANRRFGFSVKYCMDILQSTYIAGHTLYHRTDSTIIAEEAQQQITEHIINKFGKEYSNPKQYQSKSPGAQQAHECLRHSHIDVETITGTEDEVKMYNLIYKRTLASQMSPAIFDKTTAVICADGIDGEFMASGLVQKFDGYLKLYQEDAGVDAETEDDEEDENKSLPKMEKGQSLNYQEINSFQVFTKPPARFSEASLVKKLEELQIGRPSTMSHIFSTLIEKRAYVERKDLPPIKRDIVSLKLVDKKIDETIRTEKFGGEKKKLFPTSLGVLVSDYLFKNFPEIINSKFTAHMELLLDKVANGEEDWKKMLGDFYTPFNELVKKAKGSTESSNGRLLGESKGKNIYARLGRFGAMVQWGESVKQEKGKKKNDKAKSDVKFASIPKDKSLDTITLEEALALLSWPKILGQYKKKHDILVFKDGKFGPYIKIDKTFVSIKPPLLPETLTLEEAIELIKTKEAGGGSSNVIHDFGAIRVLKGQYGSYIKFKDKNVKIPPQYTAETLTEAECREIVGEAKANPVKKKKWNKKK